MIAAGNLPPEGLRRFIRDPNFRQKANWQIELRQHAGADRVRLDFGVRDQPLLDGIGDHDPLHMAADHARARRGSVSPRRRRNPSLTPSQLQGRKCSPPDHHQQQTGHLQKGTVRKIKYKLLHASEKLDAGGQEADCNLPRSRVN